jgi:two-component sensor histidine kinase
MLRKTSIGDRGASSHHDLSTAIAAVPANARQRKIAYGAFIVLAVVTAANVPLAHIQLGRIHNFMPVIQTAMCIANLLTAIFLFAQYSIYPQRALLALAGGFVFNGLFAVLHMLAFPAAYRATAVIGDKLNSGPWLFTCWQTTFPLAVIVYALSKDAAEPVCRSNRSTGFDVAVTIACVVTVTVALTWLVTAGVGYLPSLHQSEIRRTSFGTNVSALLALLNITGLAVLFVRRRTLLDQWLLVTLAAWLPRLVMGSFFNDFRFSEVWYLTWMYALFAGSSLLFVLLTETVLLYRRSDQSQKLLIAELDHRVKNILAQVAVVAGSTRQSSRSIDEFLGSLDGRIQSMAAAHSLLSENHWGSVGLDALVNSQLAPYAAGTNVRIGGPGVMLAAAETQAVTRVLHELATNAAKYGALSVPGGQVSVSWELKQNGAATDLTLLWRELGGPPVASEHPSSYGTNLICNLIPYELGGTVDLVFAKEGVNCRIEIPVMQA